MKDKIQVLDTITWAVPEGLLKVNIELHSPHAQ